MPKTETIRAHVDAKLKAQAEAVLEKLGLNASEAIRLFYKQVALRKGLLGDELVGERARFGAETVAPARNLAQSVVASLDRARLRYIEGLVILN